ncbi:uncharacterized protein PGTG_15663 [Puccinia graminis f. sp. tritici CRL 75-36-700-3]|uniref:DUF7872 domain-containing protein n=1 Tax=Puccinia graminis f. sp. tritici (strain CRL 75-36-700-3 / race SCCL) TaxID=418459 RepID=E3KYY9_PUCGT|nr:uncharacterized protein PGTG_15663 [Puccinia graminis f. sp. tritici CRL 75-36-700-3]EFP89514.1 hypothetical protein PGTG_15663 [Puccinia graminis f. sp. tritici CRL 75-36-700-3]
MKAVSFKAYSWSIALYWGLVLNSIFFSTADDVLHDESENRKATSRANNQTDIDLTNASATTQNLAPPKLLTNPHDSDDLAVKSKLLNFDCGIDKLCYAGQLCSPVKGKDWYVLVAAQEWNSYMNVVYQAVGFAMTMMQGIIPSMIKDFFPDEHDDWAIAKAYLTFFSSCAKVHPTEGHISNTKWWMQLVQGQIGLTAGEANIMDYAVIPDPVNQHDKLSKTQDLIQSKLTQNSEEIISSGISTDQGIYGVLKDGAFLIDHVHCQSLVNLAAGQQKIFHFTWELFEKYNFTAKFLTERAWKCQSNTKQFQPEVWNLSKPIKIDSECSFNLAVCDLTAPDTRELRKQGKSITKICRNYLGLPI